ncbi:soyasapogenol B glucuronide galactosyltransferase-like protein [Tanacetum coccineum]
MATSTENLHVIFVPFFASSHIIPLVHVARLFAARGVRSTIITTVHNALIFQTMVDRDIKTGHPISVQTIDFPSSEVGLPKGIENVNSVKSPNMASAVYRGMMMLQKPMEQMIRDLVPDCIFSDMFFPWTVELAGELNIPRSQVSEHLKTKTGFGEMIEKIQESEKRSYGLVHNTLYEIEPDYVDHFKKIKGTKVWHIGPLFQFFNNDHVLDDKYGCLNWLDQQNPKSVIYVCFGSMVKFPDAQITEIALALEQSEKPFIWVVRKGVDDEQIEGMPEGFEERVERENKGLVITGWAPQVEILKHLAVGGFLTHCGWNSVLEAVVVGVPLITWPLYAEHFYNEKLVEMLGIGVGVGAQVWNSGFEITSPIIGKQGFIDAIEVLTGRSSVAESIRQNSKDLAIKAKKAVEEGGSSTNSLTALIEDLKATKLATKP